MMTTVKKRDNMRNMKPILVALALMAVTSGVSADVVRGIVEKISDTFTEQEAKRVLQNMEVDIQRDGDDVRVTIEAASDRRARSLQVDIRVIVPSRFNVDVRTGGGGIDIDDLEGNVLAHTSGGGIDVGDVTGDLMVRTAGGGIEVEGSGGSIAVRTSGGGIVIEDAGGPVSAQTSGGGIRLDGAAGWVDVHTSGGGINLDTIDESSRRIEARGKLNGGGDLSRLRTTNGDIKIQKR